MYISGKRELTSTSGTNCTFLAVGILLLGGTQIFRWKVSTNALDISGFEYFVFQTLLWLFGILLTLIGTFNVMNSIQTRKQSARLKKNGIKIIAEVIDRLEDASMTSNGVHPAHIICRSFDPTTKMETSYQSESIFGDIAWYMGKKIVVYIDRQDPNIYFVDWKSLK